MSGNQKAKNKMIRYYGRICMVEEAGIRKIPREERMKIKGYKKTDDMITFHHLVPRRKGGKATPENGALVKDYNHRWLESLPSAEREQVNDKLREFKMSFAQLHAGGKGLEIDDSGTLELDFGGIEEGDNIIIPVFPTSKEEIMKRKQHKSRAQLKREFQQEIEDALYDDDLEL